jgi:hypothetical protein
MSIKVLHRIAATLRFGINRTVASGRLAVRTGVRPLGNIAKRRVQTKRTKGGICQLYKRSRPQEDTLSSGKLR